MERRTTLGCEALGRAGLVACSPCGHWRVYPDRATAEQLHDLAQFDAGLGCTACTREPIGSPPARPDGASPRAE